MLILAIVVGSVAPSLRGFAIGRRSSNTAQAIVNLGKYAGQQAVADGRVYRLNIDDQAVWLTYEDGPAWPSPANDFGRRVEWTDDLTITTDLPATGERFVEFHPSGRCDVVRFTIADRFGSVIQIGVATATERFGFLPTEER